VRSHSYLHGASKEATSPVLLRCLPLPLLSASSSFVACSKRSSLSLSECSDFPFEARDTAALSSSCASDRHFSLHDSRLVAGPAADDGRGAVDHAGAVRGCRRTPNVRCARRLRPLVHHPSHDHRQGTPVFESV